jgi:hypothetical protein
MAAQVSATETRVGTMGGVGLYTHDNSNIFYFPGAIYTYSGQVVGEFRSKQNDTTYTIGINYPVGDYSVVGVYLNRPINVTIPGGIVQNVMLNHTTDIFYGTQMSKYDLGLSLSLGLDAQKSGPDSAETKESARYIALGAGLSNESMDVGVRLELPSAKFEPPVGDENKWSGFNFGIGGRVFRGETTQLVPLAALYMSSTKGEVGAAETKYGILDLGLGVGVNHELNEKNLLVMGLEVLGIARQKADVDGGTTTTITTTTLPGLYMGLESEIKPWLTGRLGAAQVYQSQTTKVEPDGGTETSSTERFSNFDVRFGLGIHFGDFLLDAAINEGLIFDGPNFISGSNNPMASRLSLTYEF